MPESLKDKIKTHLDGTELDLSMLGLDTVPYKPIGDLPKATSIDLSNNLLRTIPMDFCYLDHIVKLDLSKNMLTTLPKNVGSLFRLKHLDLFGNQIGYLPLSFCGLKSLQWLDLKDNPLEPDLLKVAGDCLDEKQCRSAAKKVLSYMRDLESSFQRALQKKLLEERAVAEEQRHKRSEEEAALRELKKQERIARKEASSAMRQKEREDAEENKRREGDGALHEGGDSSLSQKHQVAPRKGSVCSAGCFLVLAILMAVVGVVCYWLIEQYGLHDDAVAKLNELERFAKKMWHKVENQIFTH